MKNDKIRYIIINIFWFILLAFISYRMPMYVDDTIHAKSFISGEKITGLGMIWPSVMEYYQIWGGRAVSMFLIQLMLMAPKWIYAASNASMYVLLVNTEAAFARNLTDTDGRKYDTVLLSVLYLITWYCMPDFMEVVTWTTGSITYLWMNTLILILGYLYYRDYRIKTADASGYCDDTVKGITIGKLCTVLGYAILGLCAGWSDEAGSCTLILALALYCFAMLKSGKKISVEKWIGMVTCIAGFVLLLFAPGNMVRIQASKEGAESGASFVSIYFHRICRETFYMLLFLTVPAAIMIFTYLCSWNKSISVKKVIADICGAQEPFFMCLAFVSIYVMTFSSGFANRIYQFPLIMISVATGLSVMKIRKANSKGSDNDVSNFEKAVRIFVICLMIMAVIEVTAGTLFGAQAGSFFDRQMMYYHFDDHAVDGLLPGNGLN